MPHVWWHWCQRHDWCPITGVSGRIGAPSLASVAGLVPHHCQCNGVLPFGSVKGLVPHNLHQLENWCPIIAVIAWCLTIGIGEKWCQIACVSDILKALQFVSHAYLPFLMFLAGRHHSSSKAGTIRQGISPPIIASYATLPGLTRLHCILNYCAIVWVQSICGVSKHPNLQSQS